MRVFGTLKGYPKKGDGSHAYKQEAGSKRTGKGEDYPNSQGYQHSYSSFRDSDRYSNLNYKDRTVEDDFRDRDSDSRKSRFLTIQAWQKCGSNRMFGFGDPELAPQKIISSRLKFSIHGWKHEENLLIPFFGIVLKHPPVFLLTTGIHSPVQFVTWFQNANKVVRERFSFTICQRDKDRGKSGPLVIVHILPRRDFSAEVQAGVGRRQECLNCSSTSGTLSPPLPHRPRSPSPDIKPSPTSDPNFNRLTPSIPSSAGIRASSVSNRSFG
ncbi:hypothetical protein OCU04_007321 [Sclerotinia nivalis]|uniref:Uncharacterized protein n=1 Tax=Sclerotinia nivalis TaxID=352851 RepID=A0A9X0AMG3_9HELO|nr:hypothetical protein OCU04_007321 [Sclerotinia nivalis]